MIKTIDAKHTHSDYSTNSVLETKIKLATVVESFDLKHQALPLYLIIDDDSPYAIDNLRHGIIIDTSA